jgi:hypothetical protein
VLAPDLHVNAAGLVLTIFVTPKPGPQVRAANPETPVRVALPQPVGLTQLTDGAIYDTMPGDAIPTDDVEADTA